MRTQNARKLPQARKNGSYQVAIDFSFAYDWWEGGASFLDQSQSVVKQNQCNPGYFRHSIENCSRDIQMW